MRLTPARGTYSLFELTPVSPRLCVPCQLQYRRSRDARRQYTILAQPADSFQLSKFNCGMTVSDVSWRLEGREMAYICRKSAGMPAPPSKHRPTLAFDHPFESGFAVAWTKVVGASHSVRNRGASESRARRLRDLRCWSRCVHCTMSSNLQ